MGRLTDNDHKFGPFTAGKTHWSAWRVIWDSGGGDDEDGDVRNTLSVWAFGWVAEVALPNLLRPYRERHEARGWDEATIKRLGRNWYEVTSPRAYGFALTDGFLQVFLGVQSRGGCSRKDQGWSCFLPWTQWRFVEHRYYDLDGNLWAVQPDRSPLGNVVSLARSVPTETFEFDDHDGTRIVAKTRIEEREWSFGTGWCRWLRFFRRNKVRRSLDLEFSAQVGPDKGSWKGGTVGHSADMLPGELHEDAFRRYCQKTHNARGGRTFTLTYAGRAGEAVSA